MNNLSKPKLVFFRWIREGLPNFIRLHLCEQVKCLSAFFEVTVIDYDCDYAEICDKHQPDLALFESGVYAGKREIRNISAHRNIPRLGFCNADSFCGSRDAFFSDMEHWDIEYFFSISVSFAEYTPEIADRLFVWPNFADTDLYRDYGEHKVVPVLITGSQSSLYPWRNKIRRIVPEYFPSLICPHFGWNSEQMTLRMIYGEQYARMLNASKVIPACGTIAKDIVRKHFEIPACRACLLTERSPALEAAGFIDMQNCIFADETDVLEKLDYLFRHPDELERITDSGYQLVQSRHGLQQRNQIVQWYDLHKALKPDQKIVQNSPFEPLAVVDKSTGATNRHIIGNGLDRVLLRSGDEKLRAGKYDEAKALYLGCLNYYPHIPEAQLRLTLCNLCMGNAEEALHWIVQPIKATLDYYLACDPDPVEWACFIITLLCRGELDKAANRADQFACLHHPELDRTRWVVNLLAGGGNKYSETIVVQSRNRISVHRLPVRTMDDWIENLCVMLGACRQTHLAKTLRNCVSSENESMDFELWARMLRNNIKPDAACKAAIPFSKTIAEPCHVKQFRRVKDAVTTIIRMPLHFLERKIGYFLPYRYSLMKTDEFYRAIQKLVREENIKVVTIIGATAGEGSTEALLAGIRENRMKPTVICVNKPTRGFNLLKRRLSMDSYFIFCNSSTEAVKQERGFAFFDVAMIDGSSENGIDAYEEVYGSGFILLDDINGYENHKNFRRLHADPSYTIMAQNISHNNGYAIFKKMTRPESDGFN